MEFFSIRVSILNSEYFFLDLIGFNWIQLDAIGLKNCISYSKFWIEQYSQCVCCVQKKLILFLNWNASYNYIKLYNHMLYMNKYAPIPANEIEMNWYGLRFSEILIHECFWKWMLFNSFNAYFKIMKLDWMGFELTLI